MPTVLLADDDKVFQHALHRYLLALGYDVMRRDELARLAASKCARSSIRLDAAVLGVDPHGLDFGRARTLVRQIDPDVPVLLLLNNVAPSRLAELLGEANIVASCCKPVLIHQVEAILRDVTAGRVARLDRRPCTLSSRLVCTEPAVVTL